MGNRVEDIVRNQLFDEATKQKARGECYPTTKDQVGQRYDMRNLQRAWSYGLRLVVMHALSNEFLCKVGNLTDLGSGACPSDQEAIEDQLQVAQNTEKVINSQFAPGTGWYQVVDTPAEARQVIREGKLAVVLGLEAVNAFGCQFAPREVVEGVPNLGGQKPEEQAFKNACNGSEEYLTQRALALFERYWGLGARHFYPIHNMDGVAGGTAISIPLLHSDTYPTRLFYANLLDKVADINRVITAIRPPLDTVACAQFEFDKILTNRTAGRCNARGLTDTGRALIRMMASQGAVIDIDHMSLKAKREVLAGDGLLGGAYPFVSSHGSAAAISHGDESNEGALTDAEIDAINSAGGAFAALLPPANTKDDLDTYPSTASVATHDCGGTTESWVQTYRYFVDKLRAGRQLNGTPAYPGVGIGTDFSAPGTGGPQPRFVRNEIERFQVIAERFPGGGPFGSGPSVWIVKGAPFFYGGRCYAATDPNAPPRLEYRKVGDASVFTSTSPVASGVEYPQSNVLWTGAKPEPYDISFDGVAHIGMIPDFVEELRTMGLTDLDPLWHGAEAYIRAWEASIAWTGSFNEEDNKGITTTCSQLRSDLLAAGGPNFQTTALVEQLKQTGCHGT